MLSDTSGSIRVQVPWIHIVLITAEIMATLNFSRFHQISLRHLSLETVLHFVVPLKNSQKHYASQQSITWSIGRIDRPFARDEHMKGF
jgi:hypothetical protein